MQSVVDVSKGRVVRSEDGVIAVLWDPGVVVEVADIETVLEAELSLLGTDDAIVMVDSREVRSMTRAAQRLTAQHPIAERTLALAILIAGPVSRMLGNFFLNVSRPSYPTRLFTDEELARAWLRSHRG